jgi:hypothetical protein
MCNLNGTGSDDETTVVLASPDTGMVIFMKKLK